jgi:uncharacterized phage protein (TIGR02220 family)
VSEKGKREFKGIWFPAEVWLDERLTALEKMILMEIDSLDNEDNCYASNEHLAKFCQCSQSKVSAAISKLKKLGYVRVKSFDGRKRILESCLTVSIEQTNKKEKSAQQNLEERVLVETTSESTKEDIPFFAIIEYLNEKAGTRYKASTPKTQAHIRARWGEGYRLDDFKRVIDVKCDEWLNDTKMRKYLCPDTLFGTKFEKYLNQPMAKTKKGRLNDYNYR